jgi:DNA-binding NarL/FixJ family response regulator
VETGRSAAARDLLAGTPTTRVTLIADSGRAGVHLRLASATAVRSPQVATLETLGATAADLVVLALDGAVSRWIASVRAAREALPDAVVACVLEPGAKGGAALLQAGADGVLLEDSLESTLELLLEAVSHGHALLPRTTSDTVERPLSTRERQILGMVTMGLSNGEIAAKLYITEHTVKSHLSSAFAKLHVRTRTEATARILADSDIAAGILGLSESRDRLTLSRAARTTQ